MSTFLLRSGWFYRNIPKENSIPAELKIGTLAYTAGGLLVTCMFLLIGSFGYNLVAIMIGNLLPRQLDQLGANNTVIAFVVTTLPAVIGLVFNPVFSTWSDRTRSRWGRRRPFLFVATPLISICLVVIGWAPQLSLRIMAYCGEEHSWIPLVLLGLFTILYNIVFMFPCTVLWYLFPDTIPCRYLARYMAFYNMFGQGAGVFFGYCLMPYAFYRTGWLYTGVAVFFWATLWLMLFCVQEGSYPAVDLPKKKTSAYSIIKRYVLECYSIPFYYCFFLAIALSDVSTACRTMYNLLYAEKQLCISPEAYGDILAYCSITGVILSIPVGYFADRFHPMRLYFISLCTVVGVNAISFFWVHDEWTFLVTSIALTVVYTMQMVCTIPVFATILPQAQYGQFSSATAILRAVFTALGGLGGGIVFDYLQDYQYIYAWDLVFTVASLLCFLGLYSSWKKRGGREHYHAPIRVVTE